jgi:hypothetical protein
LTGNLTGIFAVELGLGLQLTAPVAKLNVAVATFALNIQNVRLQYPIIMVQVYRLASTAM